MTAYNYYLFVINISVLVKIQALLNKKALKSAPELPHSSIFSYFSFCFVMNKDVNHGVKGERRQTWCAG